MTEILNRLRTKLTLPGLSLTVLSGPDAGRTLAADRNLVRIGSARDNDLILTDRSVSRHHARLELRADALLVEDLGSTNGTRVDGVRVVRAYLTPGSKLEVGGTCLRVQAIDRPVHVALSNASRFGGLLGESVEMRQVFATLERVAPTDATVLVLGETGTGKELVAEAIHAHSARAEGPFVTFDASAVSPSLIESQLFGHVRGAFTGANSDRRGVFEEAHGGTLFIDEIGELPLELQPKLLRALESRTIARVGESRARAVDVRVLAATHRDLAAAVNRGAFREDLYFRLAVVTISLPPLARRQQDIPLLVRHFWRRFSGGQEPPERLVEALAARSWPGNVRELRNAVERAFVLGDASSNSGRTELFPQDHGPRRPGLAAGAPHLETLFALPIDEARERAEAEFFRRYLDHVIARAGGSVSGAARIAGTNRRYIQRLMRRYGVRAHEDDDGEWERG